MKYTAFNIGPIIDTLKLVRKPRHLWSASYMFSHLMGIIINKAESNGAKLLSPAKLQGKKLGVGLYPDRAFFSSANELEIKKIINESIAQFSSDIALAVEDINNYFNIMGVSIENSSESTAILELNSKLDVLELSNRPQINISFQKVFNLITPKTGAKGNSSLFQYAFASGKFPIESIMEIASVQLKSKDEAKWNKALLDEDGTQLDEESFYNNLKKSFNEELSSHHKYFCVVQADGDRMGDVIKNLIEGNLNTLSTQLIEFGKSATLIIRQFGGIPIYAGGDDLLFLAPVIGGNNSSILDLLEEIDTEYKKVNEEAAKLQNNKETIIKTSMSYGVSITYYKHPLYEALANARNLLFGTAKEFNNKEKNTIACTLVKHSGSSFSCTFSKNNEPLKEAFSNLIKTANDNNLVSAVAHKLRYNNVLLSSIGTDKNRLTAFCKNYLELTDSNSDNNKYLLSVKNLLEALMQSKGYDKIDETVYGMLRISKFINGEDLKDE